VAVPVSGRGFREVAVGTVHSFWVEGDTIIAASAGEVRTGSLTSGALVSFRDLPLPAVTSEAEAEVIDKDFVYTAMADNPSGLTVARTPRTGGGPTVLYSGDGAVLGFSDAGDAVLLLAGPAPLPGPNRNRLLRVPKDGSAASELRSDVTFDSAGSWLAWTGASAAANVDLDGMVVAALVPLDGGPPVGLRVGPSIVGGAPTAGGAKVLSDVLGDPPTVAPRRLMLQSLDATGAHVMGCTDAYDGDATAIGVATDASGTYVAYSHFALNLQTGWIVLAKAP
jgi:hypothetical protein